MKEDAGRSYSLQKIIWRRRPYPLFFVYLKPTARAQMDSFHKDHTLSVRSCCSKAEICHFTGHMLEAFDIALHRPENTLVIVCVRNRNQASQPDIP